MSGVIINGIQYEHCNVILEDGKPCDRFPRLSSLGYEKPSKKYPHGRMVCIKCANKMDHWHLSRLVPAPDWKAVRG